MAEADIPADEPLSKNIPGDLSYEEQLTLVESVMTCYDTPLTQAAGYTRNLLKTIIQLQVSSALKSSETLIQKLEKRRDETLGTEGGDAIFLAVAKAVYNECIAITRTHELSEILGNEAGDKLPAGMVKISKLITDLQRTMADFGDTCVYIKPGVSWGAVALNRQADDEKAIEETAASFAGKFRPGHKELAQQIMGYAISDGWVHKPKREAQPSEISVIASGKDTILAALEEISALHTDQSSHCKGVRDLSTRIQGILMREPKREAQPAGEVPGNKRSKTLAILIREFAELPEGLESDDSAIDFLSQDDPGCLRMLRTIAAEIDETAQPAREIVDEWMPFETAPKDGNKILVWLADEGFSITAAWREPPATSDETECWWSYEFDYDIENSHNPTHWMPMPKLNSIEGGAS